MTYHHVWVRSPQYRGSEALTYHFESKLSVGSLVEVPLRKQKVLGVVVKNVPKPDFATKPIAEALPLKPLPLTTLTLAKWLKEYYPAPIGVITQQFLPRIIKLGRGKTSRSDRETRATPIQLPSLTAEQTTALKQIKEADTYIVHGRTGSGKTRLYLELAKKSLSSGKSALILSPEIGLTSQIAINFRQLFDDRVVVLHSQLTPKERQQAWLAILEAVKPLIVIGPRSALFSPLQNIGLVVVDESHDQAYKQEQAPYYSALRVASQLAHIHKAILIFGSATPSVSEYYLALEKQKHIIELEQLALPRNLKDSITVVDLKNLDEFTRTPHLSVSLIKAITDSLEKNEQALLYLNRRGTARITLCRHCGWQAVCPHCNLPLIYHGDTHRLQCHVCGHRQAFVTVCPVCGNAEILLQGFGTKAIAEEVQHIFPEARIMRFDADNTKAERLETQYQHIIDGEVDILVGTQVLAKGLDLPRLSTLGVVAADSSLLLPDYTAQERTYQLLTQVLGRVGRGHVVSHAIIQTYHPDSQLLQSVLRNDWKGFYELEIAQRKQYLFPPFCHILKLTCRRSAVSKAEKAALDLKADLISKKLAVDIEGPAPSFHEKVGGKYSQQLVVKSSKRSTLLAIIGLLPSNGWSYDLDPIDLL
jgi:primosomal protein N' (replication factor Y) (superfamily II helicase)